MASSKEKILVAARELVSFINKSPSPFHAVDEVKKSLLSNGFQELKETESWKINRLKKYFVTKNQSTIIAFAVGGNYEPGNGFSIVGAHTDSPCLKVKPVSNRVKQGFCQVGVECYGGGIWNTWFDRDLTVAGRVLVKDKNDESISHSLVHIPRPILRIPHLAIHLQRDINDSFGPNKENHFFELKGSPYTCYYFLCTGLMFACGLVSPIISVPRHLANPLQLLRCPVLATCVKAELEGDKPAAGSPKPADSSDSEPRSQASKHPPTLVQLLCQELQIESDQIMDFELCLADTQPAVVGGAYNEFLFAPRLDNLFNAYSAFQGLLASLQDDSLEKETNIRMISLFDNEEVGSESAQGAGSTFQELVMRRISSTASNSVAFEESIGKSYMVSADQAHACHPNYSDKHESNHQPEFNKGIVIKFNSNQRYATTSITATILRQVAKKVAVPLQDFVVRNDSPCGSTIGPIMSAKLGLQTIDVGAPQLAMHSIREMGGVTDVIHAISLFEGFFRYYPEVQASLKF